MFIVRPIIFIVFFCIYYENNDLYAIISDIRNIVGDRSHFKLSICGISWQLYCFSPEKCKINFPSSNIVRVENLLMGQMVIMH